MSIQKSKKLALIGIVLGIVLASIVSDDIIFIQAKSQAQKDLAEFYIGIVSIVSASTTLLTTIEIIQTRSVWIIFVRATSATVTLVNILFLTVIPQILISIKS